MYIVQTILIQMCLMCCFPQQRAALGTDASSICRFGDVQAGCALPCDRCTGECDKTTGECLGQCEDGPPQGYPWHGPGCRIGNFALGRRTSHKGEIGFTSGVIFGGQLLVDGDVRNRFEDGSCCWIVYKKPGDEPAWIYVNLGGVYKVQNVTLVNTKYTAQELNTEDYYKIGGEMRLGVSMTTDIPAAPSCVIFTTWLENGETKNLNLTCTEDQGFNIGRYFFIQRLSGSFNQRRLSLCEVILDAYEVIDCSSCPGDCNDLTGCADCSPGVKYPDCKQDCTSGSWGQNCEQRCPPHCHQEGSICDIRDGKCVRCEDQQLTSDWYTGEKCDVIIPSFQQVTELRIESVTSYSMVAAWSLMIDANISTFYGFQWILKAENGTEIRGSMRINDARSDHTAAFIGLIPATQYHLEVIVVRVAENGFHYPIPGSSMSLSVTTSPGSLVSTSVTGIILGCIIVMIALIVVATVALIRCRTSRNGVVANSQGTEDLADARVEAAGDADTGIEAEGDYETPQEEPQCYEELEMDATYTNVDGENMYQGLQDTDDKVYTEIIP